MSKSTYSKANNPLVSITHEELMVELRHYAQQQLPHPMVPAKFVVLNELPKLPNGKIDRKKLPQITQHLNIENTFVPPTTTDEIKIANIWQTLLSVKQVGIDDSFFDLGGDSLSVVQMASKIREEYATPISLRQLFKNPTIRGLTEMLGAKSSVSINSTLRNLTDEELLNEAILPEDITINAHCINAAKTPYKYILLTGGTGYTGAFLLRELLDRSTAKIYVLVRAKNNNEAMVRVRDNMESYDLWHDADAQRLISIAGDISCPYFKLNRSTYAEIADKVEMIMHNAALSSYAMPYRQLKPINVLGTIEVLRLACKTRIKPVHYISSLSVFSGRPGEYYCKEETLLEPNGVVGGYRQSKWVADRLINLAGLRGLPVCIYRPGQITGSQSTGACSTDTYLNAAIKGCIQLKAALPFDVVLEITPVDYCAAAVSYIALSGEHHGSIFHLNGTQPVHWQQIIDMLGEFGYSLATMPYPQWYQIFSKTVEQVIPNELTKFFPLFGADMPSVDAGDEGSRPHYSNENLQLALKKSGIQCPVFDKKLFDLYIQYFISIGYLNLPTKQGDNHVSSYQKVF